MARASASLLLSTFICILSWVGPAQGADAIKSCVRCHGADGNSAKSTTPSIAGQQASYIENALRGYREGSRACGKSKIKCKMAAKWTDPVIAEAAAHFAASPRIPAEQPFDAQLAAAGKALHQAHCANCHAADTPPERAGSALEGQWREYLDYALDQYDNGGRQQPQAMKSALEALSEADRDALLHYYASGG